MIVSFSGCQSSGKSTLLKACKELYIDRFEFVDEVTRLVKREFNVNINEEGNDLTQCLIVNKHIENTMRMREKEGVIFDRCILDGLCYTGFLTIDEKVSKWVFDYTSQIYKEIVGKLDYIFYTEPSDVTLVDDGERSVNVDFRNKMIETFEFVLERDKDTVLKDKVVRLKGTVEERMEQIKLIIC
jgi:predicted ATPase